MVTLRVNDQVRIKTKMPGRNLKVIKVGTILAFKNQGKIAIVSVEADRTRKEISVDELEAASASFGRARVQVNPAFRNIASLMPR